jgi:hypothetical protein
MVLAWSIFSCVLARAYAILMAFVAVLRSFVVIKCGELMELQGLECSSLRQKGVGPSNMQVVHAEKPVILFHMYTQGPTWCWSRSMLVANIEVAKLFLMFGLTSDFHRSWSLDSMLEVALVSWVRWSLISIYGSSSFLIDRPIRQLRGASAVLLEFNKEDPQCLHRGHFLPKAPNRDIACSLQ